MLEFLRPIAEYALGIYVILGGIALFFIFRLFIARRNRARSIFTLERETASSQITNAFVGLLVTIGIAIGTVYLIQFIPTVVPELPETPTPTPPIEIPDTPTPPLLLPTPTTTPTPTATQEPLPTGEFEVTFTPAPITTNESGNTTGQRPNCPIPGNQITQPGNGALISGSTPIIGSANSNDFQYYKFEYRISGTGDWSWLMDSHNPVSSGTLWSWDTSTLPANSYDLRLVVVDNSGNFIDPPCMVQVMVQ